MSLVIVTLIAATSFGFQLFTVWLLVPLHWLAAKDANVSATVGWAALSMALTGPATLLVMYVAGASGWPAYVVAAIAVVGTGIVYLNRFATRNDHPAAKTFGDQHSASIGS